MAKAVFNAFLDALNTISIKGRLLFWSILSSLPPHEIPVCASAYFITLLDLISLSHLPLLNTA